MLLFEGCQPAMATELWISACASLPSVIVESQGLQVGINGLRGLF